MGMFDDVPMERGGRKSGMFGDVPMEAPQELSGLEKFAASLPDWMTGLDDARNRLRGTAVEGVSRGMLSPFTGAVQLAANVAGGPVGLGGAVNAEIDASDKRYQDARAAKGRTGIDAAELVGNVISPFNAILAAKGLGAGLKGWQAAKAGAAIGAGASAAQPVVGAKDFGDFAAQKAQQTGSGALTGFLLAPAIGALADKAVRWLKDAPEIVGARASLYTDDAIKAALRETGQTADDIPADQLDRLRAEVLSAMKGGKKLDAAAALRKADFDALNIKPTLGQITRDPNLYAKEKNLQSIGDAGAELTKRFSQQNAKLSDIVGAPARGAKDAFSAGADIISSLKKTDDVLGRHVSGLYREARAVAPGAGEVPLQGLAQDTADILRRYEGVPALKGIRNILEDVGALGDGMRQMKVFGYDDAEALLKQVNKLGGDKTTEAAAGELRTAIKRAITEGAGGAGPYDSARKAASARFGLHDAIPALKAATEGKVPADAFVNRFIVNGDTKGVKELANVLKSTDPNAYGEARAQLADTLRRAAFGENAAGDAAFAPARYMAAVRKIGPHKLSAFFNAKEVDDILRVGRVGAFMRSHPSDAPVNTSRSAGAAMWMLSKVPGGNALSSLGQAAARTVKGSADARRAVAAQVPVAAADLTPRQRNLLAVLMGGGAVAGGAITGSAAR